MMSLGSLLWRHYVWQQPSTFIPAKAKADIAHARLQSQSLSLGQMVNLDLTWFFVLDWKKKLWLRPWEEKNGRERITKGHKTIQVFLLKCHNICPLEHMTNHYKFLGKQDSYRQEAQTLMYLAWAAEPSSVCQLFLQSKCSDWEDVIFAQFLRSK